MIEAGTVCISVFPYYNAALNQNSYKKRPVLIIGKADSGDYNVLPISRVTTQKNLDADYDIKIESAVYPKLNLNNVSYVRTHKQTVVNSASIAKEISDMKNEYPDLFSRILCKLEEYNTNLINSARE